MLLIRGKYGNIRNAIILIALVLASKFVISQDLHFSQSFQNPMYLNPALTSCSKCDMLAGLLYRDQWTGINMPAKTYSAFFEASLNPNFLYRDHFAIGGFIFSDAAGDGPLTTNGIVINAALKKYMGWGRDTLYVSIGFGVGAGQRKIDFNNLRFSSQWNGSNTNPNLPGFLENYNDNVSYFDFNGGINVYYAPYRKKYHLDAGISMMHINQPDISFAKANDKSDLLPVKITFHSRITKRFGEFVTITGGGLFASQGNYNEILFGFNVSQCITLNESAKIQLSSGEESKIGVLYGLWFRMAPLRDIIPSVGLRAFGYKLMMSYDIPFFNTAHVSSHKGSFEISLTKNLGCKNNGRCDCKMYGF